MSNVWIYRLMSDSIDYCEQEGLKRQRDLIESTPFGLIKSVFANCVTICQVVERATDILVEMDDTSYYEDTASFYEEVEDVNYEDGKLVISMNRL